MPTSSKALEPVAKQSVIVPVPPSQGLIPAETDRILSAHARSEERFDPDLRNALYTAYAPRLHRMLIRHWHRNLQHLGCELDDLEQEMFLIFDRMLNNWSGNGSFSAYVHGSFPWRLLDAARQLAPCCSSLNNRPTISPNEAATQAAQDTALLLEELAATLSPFDRDLLLRHIRDGESLADIAQSKGAAPRTMRRAWLRLRRHLQESLTNR